MKKIRFAVIILLITILAVPCFAQDPDPAVPQIIEYTGSLTKPNGSPYPGDIYDVNFQICTQMDCLGVDDPIWSETQAVEISARNKRDVDGGASYIAAYEVQLGAEQTNPIDFPFDRDYYLHVSEDTLGYVSSELFVSVTSALTAENAIKVYDSDIGDYSQVQGVNINNSKKAKKADTVYDSDDGTYKEVQAVNINNAKKADTVYDSDDGTYKEVQAVNINNAKNAEKLGGQEPSYYAIATHTHDFSQIAGTISDVQVPDSITINKAKDSYKLGGQEPAYYAKANHTHPYMTNYGIQGKIYTCFGTFIDPATGQQRIHINWPDDWGHDACKRLMCDNLEYTSYAFIEVKSDGTWYAIRPHGPCP